MTNWNQRYLDGDTPWDKGVPAPPLVEAVERGLKLSGNILVPGCGVGHDARYLAQVFPQVTVTGLDISAEALRRARAWDNPPNLEFRPVDFLTTPWAGEWDVLVEHTCFCALHPSAWPDYSRAAVRALRPGGLLVGIFFVEEQPDLDDGPPYFSSSAQLDSHFDGGFSLVEKRVPGRCFPGRENEEEFRVYRRQG